MDVVDRMGAAVSRKIGTTLICVYILTWARGLRCTGDGLRLSILPYFRTGKQVKKLESGEEGHGKALRMYHDDHRKLHHKLNAAIGSAMGRVGSA